MTDFSAEATARVSDDVYARPFGEETVLLDFVRGEYFGLDATATQIWRGIEDGQTFARIAVALSDVFDVDGGVALEDILALARDLAAHSLITLISPRTR